jgi:hypothetical protein
MQSFDRHLIHLVGDCVIPVSSQTIDAGPNQEVCSDVLSRAKKLVDIAFAIGNMDTSPWITKKLCRLPNVSIRGKIS